MKLILIRGPLGVGKTTKRAKVYGEDSARFVHMVTTKIQAGYEIDNSNLSVTETVAKIIKKINRP